MGTRLSGPSEDVATEVGEHGCQECWSPLGSVGCRGGSRWQRVPRMKALKG